MQPQILVVSNPPHENVVHETVSDVLGLAVEDVRSKVAFPAPEVLAASDAERAASVAAALGDAGLNVSVIDGHELAGVPWGRPVSDVSLGSDRLTARVWGEEIEIPFHTPAYGVYLRPPPRFSKEAKASIEDARRSGDGFDLADALEWASHLDLYVDVGGSTQRLVLIEEAEDVVDEIEERLSSGNVDRRLEGVRPRQRFIAGEADFDMDLRKAFSFGTLLLRQVLESISSELRDIPQYEFASRLSYVMQRQARRT